MTKCKCSSCLFEGRERVKSSGLGSNRIGVILPYPSEADGRKEEIAVDTYGNLLKGFLNNAGILPHQAKIIPLALCSSTGSKLEEEEAFEACKGRFEEEIKGLKLLILLGQEVCDYFNLKEDKVEVIRGSVYEKNGQLLLPTYSPSKVMPFTLSRDDANVPAKVIWQADFCKALELVEEDFVPFKENFELFPSRERVVGFIDECIKNKTLLAVDIETTGFNPDKGEVMCVGLADSPEHGICIPFIQQGGRRYFTDESERVVLKALERLFNEGQVAYQNALFDVVYMRRKGWKHSYETIKHDTMLLHHRLSPELPHRLDFITSIYGRTPYWKSLMRKKIGRNTIQDDVEFRTYNLRDCVVIHQCLKPMLKDLEEKGEGFKRAYYEESLPLLEPVGKMKENGINFDSKALKIFQATVKKEVEEGDKEMRRILKISEAFNFNSSVELGYLLFGIQPSKFKKISELDFYEESTLPEGKRIRKKGTAIYEELRALRDLKNEIEPFNFPTSFAKKTKGGQVAVNEESLLKMTLKLKEREEQIRNFKNQEKFEEEKRKIKKTLSFLSAFSAYSKSKKLLSTYTYFPLGKDGRVHPSFLIHGTNTGRLASKGEKEKGAKNVEDGLNFQNLPKSDLRVRKIFIPSKGSILISADYSNLEIVVLTYIVNDKIYEEVFKSNGNVHDINTKGLFGIDSSSKEWKKCRAAAKIFFFGGIAYGGGEKEIYNKILMEVPDINLSFEGYKSARLRWFKEHKEYAIWHDEVQRIAEDERTSEIFSGWKREMLGSKNDILKQALNTPIQGGAGHIINQATIRVNRRLRDEGFKTLLIGQIHDQLILDAPFKEAKDAGSLLKEEMERGVLINNKERFFKVDLEGGFSLGDLKKFDEVLKEIK